MRRFFVEKNNAVSPGEELILYGDEAKHIGTVLRMETGDELILINGDGLERTAKIAAVTRDSVTIKIIGEAPCAAEPNVHVTLFQCLPKAGKMETIIQKCVELGVFRVQPVCSKRCVVRLNGSAGGDKKILRYNKVSQEAAKQCGRGIAPEVCCAVALERCDFTAFDCVLVAYEDENETSLKQVLRSDRTMKNIAIVIGPEGGFEPNEVESILSGNRNAHSVSLGKRILRTETAGMAMLAMLMYELEG